MRYGKEIELWRKHLSGLVLVTLPSGDYVTFGGDAVTLSTNGFGDGHKDGWLIVPRDRLNEAYGVAQRTGRELTITK
jgi:hypothetical protein